MSAVAAKDVTGSSSLFRLGYGATRWAARNPRFALIGKRALHREDAREQRRGTRKRFAARRPLVLRFTNKPS